MDDGVAAAVRRFPTRQQAIEELARRDESFRSLCVDYAEIEAALRIWAEASPPLRERRRAEYQELYDDLTIEIEGALDAATVVPLAGADRLRAGRPGTGEGDALIPKRGGPAREDEK